MRKAGVALLVLVLGVAGARVAESAEGKFNSSPSSGKPGTVIKVSSDTPCAPPEDADDPFVVVGLLDDVDDAVTEDAFDVSDSGTWSGTITVPEDAENGSYKVAAECYPDEESDAYFAYADNAFTVGDPPPEAKPAPAGGGAEPRTLPATGDEDALPASKRPEAKPAQAVRAQPHFTG